MDKVQLFQKTEKIRSTYQKIHKIIFKYGIFLLISIFAGIKIYLIIAKPTNTIETFSSLESQKKEKIEIFVEKINQIDKQKSFKGPLVLGEINETDDYIESYNNLVYYKGFLVPRFFRVSKKAPLESIDYFNKGDYSLQELDTIFKNIFLGSNKGVKQIQINSLFPIQNDIIKDFNLECLFQKKISGIVCDIFTKDFIDNFFIYNINTDIENFMIVSKKIIQQKKYKEKMCERLLYHTYYTATKNNNIESILQECSEDQQKQYKLFIDFNDVQKELYNKFISNKIYKEDIINIYKLISFQQIINDDISKNLINVDSINGYFDFLQEILKKDKIGLFYKELTYFFNNYHIKKAIENIEITKNISNKTDIDIISKQINNINNGNILVGYKGLKEQINKNLIQQDNFIIEDPNKQEDKNQKIENLINQIKDIEIKQKFLSGSDILLDGIRKLDTNDQIKKTLLIPIKIRLEEKSNTLYLKQIELNGFEEISETINNLSQEKKRSLADLHKYIYQNIFLFTSKTNNQENSVEEICSILKDELANQEIKTCNNLQVEIDLLRKNKIITMTITHNNFLLKNIDISDIEAKQLLNEYLKDPKLSNKLNGNIQKTDFIALTKEIVLGFLNFTPKEIDDFKGSTNTIIIMERVKKYLGIQINDIAEKNNKILIDFTIGLVPFIGYYNIQEHKIFPIYFKEANKSKNPVLIKNLELKLIDEEKTLLDMFISQPLEVIKQYSPEEYILYTKFISEQK